MAIWRTVSIFSVWLKKVNTNLRFLFLPGVHSAKCRTPRAVWTKNFCVQENAFQSRWSPVLQTAFKHRTDALLYWTLSPSSQLWGRNANGSCSIFGTQQKKKQNKTKCISFCMWKCWVFRMAFFFVRLSERLKTYHFSAEQSDRYRGGSAWPKIPLNKRVSAPGVGVQSLGSAHPVPILIRLWHQKNSMPTQSRQFRQFLHADADAKFPDEFVCGHPHLASA